jgi:hypothetical protein
VLTISALLRNKSDRTLVLLASMPFAAAVLPFILAELVR